MASSGRWRLDDPTTWFRLNHVLGPSPLGNHGNSSQPTGAGYPEELQLRCYQTTQWVRTPDHWILNTEAQNPWPYVLQFLPPRLLPLRQLLRGINSDLKKRCFYHQPSDVLSDHVSTPNTGECASTQARARGRSTVVPG